HHDGLEQRQIAPVQPERQVGQQDVALANGHRVVEDPALRQRRVEAVHDAPLGLPVVPDVNAMRMTSLASIACGLNADDASLPAMSSSSGTVPGTPVPPSTSTDSSAGSPGRSSLIIAT